MQERIEKLLKSLYYGNGLTILKILNTKDSVSLTTIARQLNVGNLRFVFDSINRLEELGLVKSDKIGKERIVKISEKGGCLVKKIKEIEAL